MIKKKCKVRTSLLISCLTILLLTGSFSPFLHTAYSANQEKAISTIKKKIKKGKRKAKTIEKEIKTKKQKVKEALKKEESILSQIEDIEKQIQEKQRDVKYFDRRISQTRSKIKNLSVEIGQLTKELNKRKKYLEERLRSLYKQRYGDNVLILASATDYQDLFRKSRYISTLAFQDSRILKRYRVDLRKIESRKKDMETLRARLEANKKSSRRKKAELETARTKKDKLLLTIRSKRATYEKTIKELEESSQKLMEMIDTLEKITIPKSVTGKNFRALRRHLPWPVNGKVIVPFGKYRDPKFKITVFKNGIEIKAKPVDRPKAVAGGRIVYADWFKGYGLLLIINHGNGYHSLYGNLSEIFNKTGDIISIGTAVGKVGMSRMLNVPSLYFEIRHKGKPVDPLKWLKKTSR